MEENAFCLLFIKENDALNPINHINISKCSNMFMFWALIIHRVIQRPLSGYMQKKSNCSQQIHISDIRAYSSRSALLLPRKVFIFNIFLFQIKLLKIIQLLLNIIFTICLMIYFCPLILMTDWPSFTTSVDFIQQKIDFNFQQFSTWKISLPQFPHLRTYVSSL